MKSMDLPNWEFDPSYRKERGDDDGGGFAEFRIVNGDAEKFITLFNHHNGYYGKGFVFKCPNEPARNYGGDI